MLKVKDEMGENAHSSSLLETSTWKNPTSVLDLIPESKCFENKEFVIFVTPEDVNHPIPRRDPIKIKSELQNWKFDNIKDTAKFTRKGSLIITTKNASMVADIAKCKSFAGVKIKTNTNMDSLTTKFLLRDIPTDIDLNSVVEEISNFNKVKIIEARRFLKKDKNIFLPTNTVLITTLGTKIPDNIVCWSTSQRISIFVDSPRFCGKCYKFNHGTKMCSSPIQLCHKCGKSEHAANDCNEELSCINCKEKHSVFDKNCPARKTEMEFLKYKCVNHLSFQEARKKFKVSNSSDARPSSSTIVKSATSEYITRSEFNNLEKTIINQSKLIEELIKSNQELRNENKNILACLTTLINTKRKGKGKKREISDSESVSSEGTVASMDGVSEEDSGDSDESLVRDKETDSPNKSNNPLEFDGGPAESAKKRTREKMTNMLEDVIKQNRMKKKKPKRLK